MISRMNLNFEQIVEIFWASRKGQPFLWLFARDPENSAPEPRIVRFSFAS